VTRRTNSSRWSSAESRPTLTDDLGRRVGRASDDRERSLSARHFKLKSFQANLMEMRGGRGRTEEAKADGLAATGHAPLGVPGAEGRERMDGNALSQSGGTTLYGVSGALNGPGRPEALGHAGQPTGHVGYPAWYAGLSTGYARQPAYPRFSGPIRSPNIGCQPHMHHAALQPAKLASAVQDGTTKNTWRRQVPQSERAPVKRGHGSTRNSLNKKIREEMRKQQSKGELVVKVEPKVRSRPKYAPSPKGVAPHNNNKERKENKKGRDAGVYLPPHTAASDAAIIMASTPGIVVAGTSEPLPKIDLERLAAQPAHALKSSTTGIDTMETAARVAEVLIGLRDGPGLQESLIRPLERHTDNQ